MKLHELPTSDPIQGRKIVRFLIVSPLIILALAMVIWGIVTGAQKPIVYSCAVDTALLGPQSEDLCQLVPEGVRERNNVVVTGGFAKYSTVMRMKDTPDILFYNVLTPQEQINTLVKTPGIALYFEKFGFFWGVFGGAVLVPVLYGILLLVKKLVQERRRVLTRQERVQQKTLDFESA